MTTLRASDLTPYVFLRIFWSIKSSHFRKHQHVYQLRVETYVSEVVGTQTYECAAEMLF